MSSKYTERVKLIKRRENGNFSSSIPIGTLGLFVDMISTLDLEELIRLGGNHYVDIVDTDTTTEIKEWYFSEARGSKTLAEMSDLVTFSTVVRIVNAVENYIVDSTDNEGILYNNTETGEEGYIVERIPLPSNQLRIEMELYRFDMDSEKGVLIHKKVIYINELNGEYAIDEQIVTSAELLANINNLLEEEEGGNG